MRYPASGKWNKVVIDLPEGYWHLGAANGNSLYLQKGSKGIYRYNINNGKIKRIKANGTFARIPAQKGKYVMLWNEIKGGKYNHYLFRITDSGNLKKVKKLGTVNFHGGGEVPYSDYQFVGKKVYYLLDKSDSYVLKRCNLNGSKVETLGVFNKKKSQDFFNAHGFKGKSSEISYYKDHNYYTYKYTYKTKKLKLVEKI